MAPSPPTGPVPGLVALSDGRVHLEPRADSPDGRIRTWDVYRPRGTQRLGSLGLSTDPGSARGLLSVELPESAPSAHLQSMTEAVRLVCQWAFASTDFTAIAWLGPASPAIRAVLHQAGFRVHPFPHRSAWADPRGPRDAWFADITPQDPLDGTGPVLTAREQHVLALMARGQSNAQIAEDLGISENTVKNHVRSILEHLQAPSRTAAVVTALRIGLVSLEG